MSIIFHHQDSLCNSHIWFAAADHWYTDRIYYEYKQEIVQKRLSVVVSAHVSLIIANIATEHDHSNFMKQNSHTTRMLWILKLQFLPHFRFLSRTQKRAFKATDPYCNIRIMKQPFQQSSQIKIVMLGCLERQDSDCDCQQFWQTLDVNISSSGKSLWSNTKSYGKC